MPELSCEREISARGWGCVCWIGMTSISALYQRSGGADLRIAMHEL